MGTLVEPQVVLTHESDLDGLVSGLLLQRLARAMFASDVPLEAYHYQGWTARQLSERTAWVSDFTFEARLDRSSWLVVDHHASEAKASVAQFIHDPSKSASRLCYELCQKQGIASAELDRIVELTDIGDLFQESHADFVEACDYANLVKSYGFWNLHSLIGGRIEGLLDHPLLEVMRIKRKVEDPIGFAWAKDHVEALCPEVGLVRPVVGNTNVIVHQLLERSVTPHPVLATLFLLRVDDLLSRRGMIVAQIGSLNATRERAARYDTLPLRRYGWILTVIARRLCRLTERATGALPAQPEIGQIEFAEERPPADTANEQRLRESSMKEYTDHVSAAHTLFHTRA